MRDFNETDKQKKEKRITLNENPDNLSSDALLRLETRIRESLRDNYLPCALALKIARDENASALAVGTIADGLGIRVTDCQVGCFKIDKNVHHRSDEMSDDAEVAKALSSLLDRDELTCSNVFGVAGLMKLPVAKVADTANARNFKIRQCQLGCF